MPIDVHAHYVPRQLLARIEAEGADIGVKLLSAAGSGESALAFDYGFKTRPFFAKLVEDAAARRASLDRQRLDRQLVATWPDIYGYGLGAEACSLWHRALNDTLSEWCADHSDRFSFVASAPLVDAEMAASELDRAVSLGAVAVMISANVEGKNIGECDLDAFWSKAEALRMPVILHPVLVSSAPRTSKFGLTQIAEYTFDTTVGFGSILFRGVLDRFPDLALVLSHGGGTFPYLLGRFDVVSSRVNANAQSIISREAPSSYATRVNYDTIVHAPKVLRFLADQVGLDQLLLGSDESFPPADEDPLGSLKAAGFSTGQIELVADANPRRLFPLLTK
jgi:aminocarboxymuconate-semialdehyde decarboxylase